MTNPLRGLWVVGLLFMAGCNPYGSFDGKVAGNKLEVKDAIFGLYKSNGKTQGALMLMSDQPSLCDKLKANREPKEATALALVLFRVSADKTLVPPDVGDYAAVAPLGVLFATGNTSIGFFEKNDASCSNTLPSDSAEIRSGTVKITEYKAEAGGRMSGSFDLTFGGQADKAKGSFNASYCELPTMDTSLNCE